jgi:hypothetical protein
MVPGSSSRCNHSARPCQEVDSKGGVNIVSSVASSLLAALVFVDRIWTASQFLWRYGFVYVSAGDGVREESKSDKAATHLGSGTPTHYMHGTRIRIAASNVARRVLSVWLVGRGRTLRMEGYVWS